MEIDPIVKLAIEQALQFAATRKNLELKVEEFKQVIETLLKFYERK